MSTMSTTQKLNIEQAFRRFKKDHPQFDNVEVKKTWHCNTYGPKLGPILLLYIPDRGEYYIQIGVIATNSIYGINADIAEEIAAKIARYAGAQLIEREAD